jgi:hypothetical protein
MKKLAIALIVGLMSVVGLSARENSPWKEIQTVLIPQTVEVHEGVTRSGNNKYWIEVEGIKVTIAPTNVSKFQNGEVQLELVKWQNTETKAYKYSTRQVKSSKASSNKETKNIDLGGLFK